MPPVVSIVGKPDSGKTTLLERLIPELCGMGYRIGTIKHHVHEFEMDRPGKDTWRHKKAGASIVALSSPSGLGIIRDTSQDPPLEELVSRYFHDVDLVITEGYKRASMPKIEVFRAAAHATPLEGRDSTWVAMVSETPVKGLPWFAPDDLNGLAAFLVEQFITPAPDHRTVLQVDGRTVPLNDFVKTFLRRTVLGMTSSLRGCEGAGKITITIHND